jgi:hypothetical protein
MKKLPPPSTASHTAGKLAHYTMPCLVIVGAGVLLLIRPCMAADKPARKMPRQVNRPCVTVSKELYRKHPRPGASAWVNPEYVGPDLELLETWSVWATSDTPSEMQWRLSTDNGKNWSEFKTCDPPSTAVKYKGVDAREYHGPKLYDTDAGVLVETWLRQIPSKNANTAYWRLSRDHGKTWSPPKMLRYEPGDEFDPQNPLAQGYLAANQGFLGNNIIKLRNGTLVTVLGDATTPGDPKHSRDASLCFIGRWDKKSEDYHWTPGKRVAISPDKSSRGLSEPQVVELKDGRVLVVWRGSNTAATPGRKWYSLSSDGGMTLGAVKELRYDDGASFYSPSSSLGMIRHSINKKLYWVGNICTMPPSGNSPRYPLVIAEMSETIPALKKQTITVIDDKRPGQTDALQLSNFMLLENRQTHAFELYMTLLGESPGSIWNADCYRYIVTPR